MSNLKILVLFDAIVDTDYGIVQVIKEEYNNANYINKKLLNSLDDKNIFDFISTRNNKNIVYELLNNIYRNSTDNIYNELLETQYSNIIEKSSITNVAILTQEYVQSGLIDVTVLCKNKTEEQFIKSKINHVNTITANDFKMINISEYGSIFIKNIDDLLLFKNGLDGKIIYLLNYPFNFESNRSNRLIPLSNITLQLDAQFEFKVIDVYNIDDKYKIKG